MTRLKTLMEIANIAGSLSTLFVLALWAGTGAIIGPYFYAIAAVSWYVTIFHNYTARLLYETYKN